MLKLLLENKPDLTLKNKKGQTAIDITNSKIIISLFWHYLTGNEDLTKPATTSPAPAKDQPTKPTVAAGPPQKIITVDLTTPKPPKNPKELLKDLQIKPPELAKVAESRPREKKAALVGPKPVKRLVMSVFPDVFICPKSQKPPRNRIQIDLVRRY